MLDQVWFRCSNKSHKVSSSSHGHASQVIRVQQQHKEDNFFGHRQRLKSNVFKGRFNNNTVIIIRKKDYIPMQTGGSRS
jgi:hypothetical protein